MSPSLKKYVPGAYCVADTVLCGLPQLTKLSYLTSGCIYSRGRNKQAIIEIMHKLFIERTQLYNKGKHIVNIK